MALGSILVLYDASEDADAMLRLAWMDDEGQAALDHADAVARQHGVELDTWLTRARRVADALAGVMRESEVEAVFLPLCSWRHPWRRLRMLLTARAMRRQASCPVLVGTWAIPGSGRMPQRAEPQWSYSSTAYISTRASR
jgi:nucleotide-binding universal stress UspA family protein